uniref:Uncharacterized protein n=1 Tax=Anguilla anguilla TaxID=7936 RepID=A0A0E9VIH0_ANGAN
MCMYTYINIQLYNEFLDHSLHKCNLGNVSQQLNQKYCCFFYPIQICYCITSALLNSLLTESNSKWLRDQFIAS